MVKTQLEGRGIKDRAVLEAMGKVGRHLFVNEALYGQAYKDYPLPIGENQTISQPYIVALMTEALEISKDDRVLEIGTGSGYQTAILAEIAKKVYTVERIASLLSDAKKVLSRLGYFNISFKLDDGSAGWKENEQYDAIIVTAASPDIPAPLLEQLKIKGRLVIPIGDEFSQTLYKIKKYEKGTAKINLCGVRFVKLYGKHGWKM